MKAIKALIEMYGHDGALVACIIMLLGFLNFIFWLSYLIWG